MEKKLDLAEGEEDEGEEDGSRGGGTCWPGAEAAGAPGGDTWSEGRGHVLHSHNFIDRSKKKFRILYHATRHSVYNLL